MRASQRTIVMGWRLAYVSLIDYFALFFYNRELFRLGDSAALLSFSAHRADVPLGVLMPCVSIYRLVLLFVF
jgi:hypothetical protein